MSCKSEMERRSEGCVQGLYCNLYSVTLFNNKYSVYNMCIQNADVGY